MPAGTPAGEPEAAAARALRAADTRTIMEMIKNTKKMAGKMKYQYGNAPVLLKDPNPNARAKARPSDMKKSKIKIRWLRCCMRMRKAMLSSRRCVIITVVPAGGGCALYIARGSKTPMVQRDKSEREQMGEKKWTQGSSTNAH